MPDAGQHTVPGTPGYHVAVLLRESIDALQVQPDGIYLDCTFGGGGHSRALLEKLGKDGRLFAFDQDETARTNLPDDARIIFVPHNFRHIGRFLRFHGVAQVHGILADLGVSSHQFDEAERGFSIRFEADLDMRMDRRQPLTAAMVLNQYTEAELHRVFEQYGEVTNARTLAKTIAAYRTATPLATVRQFREAVQHIVKGNPNRYFAQVFQALRIVVNDEFGALREMLEQTPALLKSGGRIAVITFHSLEDRIVKNFFRNGTFNETETDEIYGNRPETPFHIITRKPILPSPEELKKNPRSRSAKLRVAERK